MVVRTQVTLDAEAHRRAKQRAAEQEISLAEFIRRAVERELGSPERSGDVREIFGIFDSGGSNIAKHKDEYIAEAVDAAHADETRP
jgi:hypothetical protein